MRYLSSVLIALSTLCLASTAMAAPSDSDAGVPVTVSASSVPLLLPSGERLVAIAAGHDDGDQTGMMTVFPARDHDPRRVVLSSLHLLTGVVQGYDGMLTLKVLKAGGVETNPLVKPMANNQGAMMALKAAAAVSTVIGVESLWKRNHRVGAIVASVAVNSAMAMVAHHNSRVLARLQGR